MVANYQFSEHTASVLASQRVRISDGRFVSRTVHETRLRRFENASLAPYKAPRALLSDRCQRAVAL